MSDGESVGEEGGRLREQVARTHANLPSQPRYLLRRAFRWTYQVGPLRQWHLSGFTDAYETAVRPYKRVRNPLIRSRRALNDLHTAGWRVVNSTSLIDGYQSDEFHFYRLGGRQIPLNNLDYVALPPRHCRPSRCA